MQSAPASPKEKLTEEKIKDCLAELIVLQSHSEEDSLFQKKKANILTLRTVQELSEIQKKFEAEMPAIQEARKKEIDKEQTSQKFKPLLKPLNAFFESYKLGGGILNTLIYFAVFAVNVAAEIIKPLTVGITGATALWGFIRATLDTSRRGNNVEQGVYGLRFGAFIATAILLILAVSTPVTAFLLVGTTLVTGILKDSYLAYSARDDVKKQTEIVKDTNQTLKKYEALHAEAEVKLKFYQDPSNIANQKILIEKYKTLCDLQNDLVKEQEDRLEKFKKDHLKEKTRMALTTLNIIGIALIFIPGTQIAGFAIFGLAVGLGALEKTGTNPVSRFVGWLADQYENKFGVKSKETPVPEVVSEKKKEFDKKVDLSDDHSFENSKVNTQQIFNLMNATPVPIPLDPLNVNVTKKGSTQQESQSPSEVVVDSTPAPRRLSN